MGKVGGFIENYLLKNLWFCVFSAFAIGILIASFVIPPTGVIDSSVLKGVAELFGFASLGTVIRAIDKGVDAKIQHNNTSVTIGDLNNSGEELSREAEEYQDLDNGRL